MTDLSQMSDADLMGELSRQKLPRGIRNNNPGNIEDGPFARSQPGYKGGDGRFAIYDAPEAGTAAHKALLRSYAKRGINTVDGVVGRWAPPSENDTGGYAKFVSQRLGVDPRAPLDLNDDQVLSTMAAAMGERENGASDLSGMSDAQLMAALGGKPGPVPVPQLGTGVTMERATPPETHPDQGLGFLKGATTSALNVGKWAARGLAQTPLNAPLEAAGQSAMKMLPPGLVKFIGDPKGYYADQAAHGRTPGKWGEFAGNVAGTAFVKGPAAVVGGVQGALLSEADNPLGVMKDAGIGAATSFGVGKALGAATPYLKSVISKAPKFLDVAGLEAKKRGLYEAVDKSGLTFKPAVFDQLVNSLEAAANSRALSKEAGDTAESVIKYARDRLAKGKVTASQLDKFRGDIYAAMVEKGGDTKALGQTFRAQIDKLFDSVPVPQLQQARKANAAWEKAKDVTQRMESGELAAGRANSGENVVNAARQKLSPMIDPLHGSHVPNLTKDEAGQIKSIVVGDRTSNGLRNTSKLLRNKFVSGPIALLSAQALGPMGGLAVMGGLEGAGRLLRGKAEKYTAGQIDDLLKLISVGGSRSALAATKRAQVPAQVAQRVQNAIAAVRGPAIAATAPALAAGRRREEPNPRKR